jgi:AAA family ATP:ADP antiporter
VKQEKALKAIFDIRRGELPLALLMFSYFFLVITSFWILKPLKKALFIEFYDQGAFEFLGWSMTGPQAELIAKILNLAVAFAAVIVFTWLVRRYRRQQLASAVIVFTWLVRRYRRQQLALIFTGFFLVSYLLFMFVIGTPGELTIWSFYLFGDLFSTLMVATFFAFLNDSVTPEAAKRLYGLVGLGGVSGGVFGSYVVAAFITQIERPQWLLICFVI